MINTLKIQRNIFYNIALIAFFIFSTISLTNCGSAEFKGTTITSGQNIPSFNLVDQYNNSVQNEDFKNRILVLTFLYSNCKEECKVIVPKISKVQSTLLDQYPEISKKTTFISISVDPTNDIPENTYKYMQLNNKEPNWQSTPPKSNWVFLSGDLKTLEAIWNHYGIAADAAIIDQGSVIDVIAQKTMLDIYADKDIVPLYKIDHSLPIYLIDMSGTTRVVFNDLKIDTQDLIHDILLLAK